MADGEKELLSGVTLSVPQIGELLGIGAERVRQLVKEGFIPKAAKNTVPVAGAVQGYLRFMRDEARRSSKSASQSRVQDARALEIERRTAREEGELVPISEARAVVQLVVGDLVSQLIGLPAQVTRDLNERRKIEAAVDAIRSKVADSLSEHGLDYGALGGSASANGEAAARRLGQGEPGLSGDVRAAGSA